MGRGGGVGAAGGGGGVAAVRRWECRVPPRDGWGGKGPDLRLSQKGQWVRGGQLPTFVLSQNEKVT